MCQSVQTLLEAHASRIMVVVVPLSADDGSACRRRVAGAAGALLDLSAEAEDGAAAARISAQQVAVLVDMNGHTRGARLGVLSWRPAPIQVCCRAGEVLRGGVWPAQLVCVFEYQRHLASVVPGCTESQLRPPRRFLEALRSVILAFLPDRLQKLRWDFGCRLDGPLPCRQGCGPAGAVARLF